MRAAVAVTGRRAPVDALAGQVEDRAAVNTVERGLHVVPIDYHGAAHAYKMPSCTWEKRPGDEPPEPMAEQQTR